MSLREDPPNKLGCKIEPANFSIDPDEYVRVAITLAGDRADIIKRQIAVTTQG